MIRFLDHVAFDVADLEASRRFYAAALGAWGAREVRAGDAFGYGPEGSEDLWIAQGGPGAAAPPRTGRAQSDGR